LIHLLVSQKYKLSDILPTYIEESRHRQIFWILKEVPELVGDDLMEPKLREKRVEMIFK